MPVYDPNPKMIEVRSDRTMGNKLLFKFNPSTMEIELRREGVIHIVKIHDLQAFANKSEETVFHAKTIIEDKDDS